MTDEEIRSMLRFIRRWWGWAAICLGAELVDVSLIVVVAIAYALFQDSA